MGHEIAAEWFRFAEDDLAAADHLLTLHPLRTEIICYHCQQSAEKYLKGYLIAKGVDEPPRTHKLDTLLDMCQKYDDEFEGIKFACSRLTLYGSQPRYPNEIEITENDMQRALNYAKQVRDFPSIANLRKASSHI